MKKELIIEEEASAIWLGLRYMLCSVLAFTVLNVCAKYLEAVSAYQIVFFRALGSLILCIAYLKVKNIPMGGTHKKLLITRGVVGTTSMALFFLAIKEIPFGSVVTLRYLSPIFAGLLAMYWLRERLTPLQWVCFIAAFIGVMMLKGFDPRITIKGLCLILTSSLFSGCVYVIIRKIGKREHPVVIVTYFMWCAVIGGGLLSIFHWNTPATMDWLVLACLGIFGYFGQYYMTMAYQTASIGVVAPMKYIESVFAIMFGWIWFGEAYTLLGLAGIFLIVGSMVLNVLVKQKFRKGHSRENLR